MCSIVECRKVLHMLAVYVLGRCDELLMQPLMFNGTSSEQRNCHPVLCYALQWRRSGRTADALGRYAAFKTGRGADSNALGRPPLPGEQMSCVGNKLMQVH